MNLKQLLPLISALIGMPAGRKTIVDVALTYCNQLHSRNEIEAEFDQLCQLKVFSGPPFTISKKLIEPLVHQALSEGIYSVLASIILEQNSLFYYVQQYYHLEQVPIRGVSEYLALVRLSFLSGNTHKLLNVVQSREPRHLEARAKLQGRIYPELKTYLYAVAMDKLPSPVSAWLLEEVSSSFALFGEIHTIDFPPADSQSAREFLSYSMLRGKKEEIERGLKLLKISPSPLYRELALQVDQYLKGDEAASIMHFEKAQKLLKKEDEEWLGGNIADGLYSLLYLLALIKEQTSKSGDKAEKYLAKLLRGRQVISAYRPVFYQLLKIVNSKAEALYYVHDADSKDYHSPLIGWIKRLKLRMSDPEALKQKDEAEALGFDLKQCQEVGAEWLSAELQALVSDQKNSTHSASPFFSLKPMALSLKSKGAWEETLMMLEKLVQGSEESKGRDRRLIWEMVVDESYQGWLEALFGARLQLKNKSGVWSVGKKMTIKQLKDYALNDDCLELDRKIIALLQDDYHQALDVFNIPECYPLLAIHPHLYSYEQMNGPRLELEEQALQVIYKQEGANLLLSFGPESIDFCSPLPIYWQVIHRHRYAFTLVSEEAQKIVKLVGNKGLRVPESEKARLQKLVSGLTRLAPVHTDQEAKDLEQRPAEAKIQVYASMVNQMLELSLWIKPFAEGEQLVRPAIGFSRMMAPGNSYQAVRDFSQEEKNLFEVRACLSQILPITKDDSGQFDYYSADLELTLDLLTALKELESRGIAQVYWPKGEALRLMPQTIDYSHLKMKMSKKNEWFEFSGELDYPSESSLQLVELIKSAKNCTYKHYIKLDDQTFIKIDRDLKRQLELLESDGLDFKLTLDRAALLAHKQFMEKLQLKNKEVTSFYQEVEDIYEKTFLPPDTFKAELRDYQLVGFNWLKRLWHLGFGACLADDMGLGKTVQTIALLLDRSSEGPSLVVAPVSVLMNWRDELSRFSPTLNIHFLSDQSVNKRKKSEVLSVEAYGPRDVLVVSYGLLQRENWMVKNKWNVVILDEAQAIKNYQTKRAQVCFKLQAKFKMITTGTPIENNLSELWSLFHFINPGLLGRFGDFSKTYMGATNLGTSSKSSFTILKKMIAPYILRRIKSDVLTELPEKTEIVLRAVLSAAERDFYESLRIKAIEDIETELNPGKRLIKMLTELTRLRQAACHPSLLNSELQFPSAKLELFWSVLEEVLQSGHKVLVFSQFVQFLKMIENDLKTKSISYHYLDGSTPQKKREAMVNSFQSGNGEVFLISLKAGGVGLNLTAADYVIHLDPWWNPAVENQATDRAHRIGQVRPVTVYKIVTEETVEEKVMALHGQKLELAKGILEGSEVPTKLDPKFLLELMR